MGNSIRSSKSHSQSRRKRRLARAKGLVIAPPIGVCRTTIGTTTGIREGTMSADAGRLYQEGGDRNGPVQTGAPNSKTAGWGFESLHSCCLQTGFQLRAVTRRGQLTAILTAKLQ